MNPALYSSATDDWETPQGLFDRLNRAFGFTLDVCATAKNAKVAAYYTPEQNGLTQSWRGRCWMNPPYGKNIGAWVRKAYESSQEGALVVCLLPARTDTRWWHDYVTKGDVHLLKGRLRFGNAAANAPFPSALVLFWPKPERKV